MQTFTQKWCQPYDYKLRLNQDKTQIIWIGTRQQLSRVSVTELMLSTAAVSLSSTVSNLGVLIDGQLNMSDHVASVCRSCYFQLRQIKGSLTSDAVA